MLSWLDIAGIGAAVLVANMFATVASQAVIMRFFAPSIDDFDFEVAEADASTASDDPISTSPPWDGRERKHEQHDLED